MDNWKLRALIGIIGLIFILVLTMPLTSTDVDFQGYTQEYSFESNSSYITITSPKIYLSSEQIEIDMFENCNILFINGTKIKLENYPKINMVFKDIGPSIIKNGEVTFKIDNLTLKKDVGNNLILSGNLPKNDYIKFSSIQIIGHDKNFDTNIDYVTIDDKIVNNIRLIRADDGYAHVAAQNVSFTAEDVSKLNYVGYATNIFLHRTDGLLKVKDRTHDVKTTDNVYLEFTPQSFGNLIIKDSSIELSGSAALATKNGNDLLINDYKYFLTENNDGVTAYATIVLVIITGLYAYSTRQLVKKTEITIEQTQSHLNKTDTIIEQARENLTQTQKIINQSQTNIDKTDTIICENKNDQKMKYIEKRLELFYYPLQYFLDSYKVWLACNIDDLRYASYLEQERKKSDKGYVREGKSILNDDDVRLRDTDKYNITDILPYVYLASEKIRKDAKELNDIFEVYNTADVVGSDEKLRTYIEEVKKRVNDEIEMLIKDHNELTQS